MARQYLPSSPPTRLKVPAKGCGMRWLVVRCSTRGGGVRCWCGTRSLLVPELARRGGAPVLGSQGHATARGRCRPAPLSLPHGADAAKKGTTTQCLDDAPVEAVRLAPDGAPKLLASRPASAGPALLPPLSRPIPAAGGRLDTRSSLPCCLSFLPDSISTLGLSSRGASAATAGAPHSSGCGCAPPPPPPPPPPAAAAAAAVAAAAACPPSFASCDFAAPMPASLLETCAVDTTEAASATCSKSPHAACAVGRPPAAAGAPAPPAPSPPPPAPGVSLGSSGQGAAAAHRLAAAAPGPPLPCPWLPKPAAPLASPAAGACSCPAASGTACSRPAASGTACANALTSPPPLAGAPHPSASAQHLVLAPWAPSGAWLAASASPPPRCLCPDPPRASSSSDPWHCCSCLATPPDGAKLTSPITAVTVISAGVDPSELPRIRSTTRPPPLLPPPPSSSLSCNCRTPATAAWSNPSRPTSSCAEGEWLPKGAPFLCGGGVRSDLHDEPSSSSLRCRPPWHAMPPKASPPSPSSQSRHALRPPQGSSGREQARPYSEPRTAQRPGGHALPSAPRRPPP